MDPASTALKFAAVLALIGINALFVAAQFALVSVRRSRLEPLARAGDRRALRVLAALDAPDSFMSAAQLGITTSSIGVGWIAESAIYTLLRPAFDSIADAGLSPGDPTVVAHAAAILLTLLVVVYLHAALGEQVPKMLATQEPERIALATSGPARLFALLLRPLSRITTLTAGAVMRLMGRQPSDVHSLAHTPDEIRMLVEQSHQDGTVEADQEQMLLGVIQLRDTLAREVMTPRRDIIALPVTATREETLALVAEEGHSRIPVFAESIDDVIGVLLVKDLLTYLMRDPADAQRTFDLARLVREPYFVPDTKRIGELLPELRTKSVHMAIVLDEFGGTDGLVTLEDMLEEIVGDIYDEHDIPEEETDFEITETGEVLIDGGASIFDVNERFHLGLPEQDYDTIGGFVFGELGRVPVAGDVVTVNGSGELRVEEVEERRVTRVRLVAVAAPAPETSAVGEDSQPS